MSARYLKKVLKQQEQQQQQEEIDDDDDDEDHLRGNQSDLSPDSGSRPSINPFDLLNDDDQDDPDQVPGCPPSFYFEFFRFNFVTIITPSFFHAILFVR